MRVAHRRVWFPILSMGFFWAPSPAWSEGSRPGPKTHFRVVITEVMVSPKAVPLPQGQWIEIQNPNADPVDLQGMVIRTASGGFHPVSPSQSMRLQPGEIRVLGPVAGRPVEGGAIVQYAYGGDLPMSASGDVLWITLEDSLVDLVTWGPESLPVEPGHSLSREPSDPLSGPSAEWCSGRDPYQGGPDCGTPGKPNTWCDSDGDSFAEDQGDCDDDNADVRPGALEKCNGIDDDCDGTVDDSPWGPDVVCPSLGVCGGLEARCGGPMGWVCDFPEDWQPVETRCDAKDNDCDGDTDEGFFWNGLPLGSPCELPGVCGTGVVVCRADGSGATCSTAPDGPDSRVSPEVCNGLDDDCDGDTDEDFPVGDPCDVGLGRCHASGVWVCSPDGWSVSCVSNDRREPIPEVCGNGLDDDCDGDTDEGFPVGEVCQIGEGSCQVVGKWTCSQDGTGVVCSALPAEPGREVCGNGLDDDCDGDTDEPDCEGPRGSGCTAQAGFRGSGDLVCCILLVLLGILRSRRPGPLDR